MEKCKYGKCFGACSCPKPEKFVTDGDLIQSRLGGRPRKVSVGPQPSGLVPKGSHAARLNKKN